jgi:hypothetical protein
MAKFFLQTVECTTKAYEFEMDGDDIDAAIAKFWDMTDEELQKAYIAEEWTGEELDFITIKEPVK